MRTSHVMNVSVDRVCEAASLLLKEQLLSEAQKRRHESGRSMRGGAGGGAVVEVRGNMMLITLRRS